MQRTYICGRSISYYMQIRCIVHYFRASSGTDIFNDVCVIYFTYFSSSNASLNTSRLRWKDVIAFFRLFSKAVVC